MPERKRLNADAQKAFAQLYGCEDLLKGYLWQFELLVKRVPNGWRDFKLILSKIHRLIMDILDTVPIEQLQKLVGQASITVVRVQTQKQVKQDDELCVLPQNELEQLVNYAAEGLCISCTRTSSYDCPLKKMLDEYPVDKTDFTRLLMSCEKSDIPIIKEDDADYGDEC